MQVVPVDDGDRPIVPLNPPRETLYINNLTDKIKRQEVKRQLYQLCSAFGRVVDVVAQGAPRKHGQAFVIFRDVQSATTCMRRLQGFPFHGKDMRVAYAREKSDVIGQLDGTFRKKSARERQLRNVQLDREWERRRAGNGGGADREPASSLKPALKRRPGGDAAPAAKRARTDVGAPNKILFVTGLPEKVAKTPGALQMLFQPFAGFAELRVPPASAVSTKGACAFAEFTTVDQAAAALNGLQGFQIEDMHIDITFASK
eukprot:TRINITY_DN1171_c5_g1_i1.p2 TRINITY_DN1171_c5_g1~~TRINITY_DN1171_c5_g1_i1.p2  ORF type:complete len:259 (+),score=80.28 TRINITY_DN1171_c5_g1_i1:219-995(+)